MEHPYAEFVGRVEKFYAPTDGHTEMAAETLGVMASAEQGHSALPEMDTTRPMVGWNYYFREGFKFSLGYGRSMTSDDAHKVWSVGLAYRFGS